MARSTYALLFIAAAVSARKPPQIPGAMDDAHGPAINAKEWPLHYAARTGAAEALAHLIDVAKYDVNKLMIVNGGSTVTALALA
eukprot:1720235-Prymnesium_polylepis.1